jgi:AraC-like DNA-binding protein
MSIEASQAFVLQGENIRFSPGDQDRLVLVRHGVGEVDAAEAALRLRARQVLLARRGADVVVRACCPLEIVYVGFVREGCFADPDGAAFFEDLLRLWPACSPLDATDDIVQTAGAVCAVLRGGTASAAATRMAARGRLFTLLALLHTRLIGLRAGCEAGIGSSRFEASLGHIAANVERRIEVAELADIAGLSPRHYSAVFRRRTGQSVARYVRSARVRFAQGRLLATGDILQASLDAGFADLSNFYRVFKSETGVTPRQYIDGRASAAPARGASHVLDS